MVENLGPVGNGHGPLGCDVTMSQVQEFADSVIGWENTLIFGDFTQLAV